MSLDIEKFIDGLHEYLAKQFSPLVRRIEALEAGHGQTPQVKFLGVYQVGRPYQSGEIVSLGGYVWACTKGTTESPGGNDAWMLCG